MTHGLPLDAVRGFLEAHGVEVTGPLHAQTIAGGRSNVTVELTDSVSRWVLRRPPAAGITPSAHDVGREWRVVAALQDTAVPVAPTVAADLDGDLLGVPFTVVGFVDGRVIRAQDELANLDDAEAGRAVDALMDTLADLHALDPAAVGLDGLGRPAGYLQRQVDRWGAQWQRVATRNRPDLDRLVDLLSARVPDPGSGGVVHGDYRIDNVLLDRDDAGLVRAVVDWELATLGDPLADLATTVAYRNEALDLVLGLPAAWSSPRLPDADAIVERYVARTGRPLEHWPFHLGLAHLKIAVIAEGIAYRAQLGAAADSTAAGAAEAVPAFVADGLRALAVAT